MTDQALPAPKRSSGKWKIIAIAGVLLVAAAAGGGYYFYMTQMAPHGGGEVAQPEPPLPSYVEIKPFVVTVMSEAGTTRFVQLGVNLAVSRSAVANLITAMLPEVADSMRLTVLRFKLGDVVTADGVDKLREALTADLNRMLIQRLGAQRIEAANGGRKEAVENVVFTNLVVE